MNACAKVRKILFCVGLAMILLSILVFSSCNQQKAIDTMMANPEMSTMLMKKVMDTPELKEKMMGMMISDTTFAAQMMDTIIRDHPMMDRMIERMMGDEYCKELISQRGKELAKGKAKK
jgi:PBP1b-binding outer membrane lipoprotein LpoB